MDMSTQAERVARTDADPAAPSEHGGINWDTLLNAYKDPHALYDAARRQGSVGFDPAGNCWLVTGHAAVKQILGDPRFCSDPSGVNGEPAAIPTSFVQAAVQRQFVFSDGEHHQHVHQAVLRESAERMQQVLPAVRSIAKTLLVDAERRGEIDLVKDFAFPFLFETICLVMGVPLGDAQERDRLAQWSTTHNNVTSGYLHARMRDIVQLGDYFRRLIAAKRNASSDDLIGTLIRADLFDDDEELAINCMMIFAAGRITTQKLLGNGVPLLLPDWRQWRETIAGNHLMSRRLTEELLRIVTPTRYLARHAAEDVDLSDEVAGEQRIRKGDRVILYLEAANHDPESFADAHCLRAERQPNAHLAFGHGSHICPGAAAARLEIQVALEVLLDTFRELRPHPSIPPTWDPNPNLGGFASYSCLCR